MTGTALISSHYNTSGRAAQFASSSTGIVAAAAQPLELANQDFTVGTTKAAAPAFRCREDQAYQALTFVADGLAGLDPPPRYAGV